MSGILAKIKELPALIFDAFKTALQTIADKVGKIASEVYDFFKPFIDFVKTSFKFVKKVLKKIGTTIFNAFSDTLGKIIDGILAIPEAVGEFIKNLFVPKDGEMDKALNKLKSAFGGLLYSYELTSLATGSKEFGDINVYAVWEKSDDIGCKPCVKRGRVFPLNYTWIYRPAVGAV